MTRGVAAFDFDGTITRRDTLVPFLLRQGRTRLVGASAIGAILSLRGARDEFRDRLKVRVLDAVFSGRDHAAVEAAGLAYATHLPSGFRPRSLDRIAWHRSQGHELVMVTASLGVYARPAGADLGFDHVIAVELETNGDGTCTGRMTGPNVRRAEKVRRLRAHLGNGPVELWAYGNSAGDEQMLATADHPTWVGPRRAASAGSTGPADATGENPAG